MHEWWGTHKYRGGQVFLLIGMLANPLVCLPILRCLFSLSVSTLGSFTRRYLHPLVPSFVGMLLNLSFFQFTFGLNGHSHIDEDLMPNGSSGLAVKKVKKFLRTKIPHQDT